VTTFSVGGGGSAGSPAPVSSGDTTPGFPSHLINAFDTEFPTPGELIVANIRDVADELEHPNVLTKAILTTVELFSGEVLIEWSLKARAIPEKIQLVGSVVGDAINEVVTDVVELQLTELRRLRTINPNLNEAELTLQIFRLGVPFPDPENTLGG
jgi:hypothetical protein